MQCRMYYVGVCVCVCKLCISLRIFVGILISFHICRQENVYAIVIKSHTYTNINTLIRIPTNKPHNIYLSHTEAQKKVVKILQVIVQ